MSTLRYTDVGWNRNQPRDQARGGETWGDQSASALPYQPPLCAPEDQGEEDRCRDEPEGGPGSPNNPGPGPCASVDGGANLVYVHGFNSDGGTWGGGTNRDGVRGRVRCALEIRGDIAPDLRNRGLERHTAQEAELYDDVDRIARQGRERNILIGHSQGGLISRRVTQRLEGVRPDWVEGVITIGTPHQGAYVALNSPSDPASAWRRVLGLNLVCGALGDLCSPAEGAVRSLVTFGLAMQGSTSDAAEDIRPLSPAIQAVNEATETFPRFGIRNEIDKRWAMARLGGDLYNGKGENMVTVVDGVVGGFALVAVVGGWVPFIGWGAAAIAARVVWGFVSTDAWWNRITSGGDESDGFIQASSQRYPNATRNINAREPTPTRASRSPSAHSTRSKRSSVRTSA